MAFISKSLAVLLAFIVLASVIGKYGLSEPAPLLAFAIYISTPLLFIVFPEFSSRLRPRYGRIDTPPRPFFMMLIGWTMLLVGSLYYFVMTSARPR